MSLLNSLINWFKKPNNKAINDSTTATNSTPNYKPRDLEELKALFTELKLDKYWENISPLVTNKIDIVTEPGEEDNIAVGRSKIGGRPDMPAIAEWPKNELGQSLSFIAQINCEETAPFDFSGLIPKQGLISFFYCAQQEAWGFDPKDKQRFKVIYTENLDGLNKIPFPDDLEEYSMYQPNKLKFDTILSIPDWSAEGMNKISVNDADYERYSKLDYISDNQLLGYPFCIQNPMEEECQLVTNGFYCGDTSGYNDPKAQTLKAGSKDWILLLQVGSEDDKTGMMWGDAGNLYFWIKKQDLANKDFDKAWFILQCY